ncbi:unnamed protein product [Coffea canephora]|uniref:RNA helicase n=1 Tax=Coffea canephora TaxID=49390 RepID=A0A068USX0_COFCA|nr:unnamed protein product [Coffea canephora]
MPNIFLNWRKISQFIFIFLLFFSPQHSPLFLHENICQVFFLKCCFLGVTSFILQSELPQYLFYGGFCRDGGVIGITQPRRVAAVSVAKRVAEECGVALGQKLYFDISRESIFTVDCFFQNVNTIVDNREALLDQCLSKYSVIIVDEAREE